MGGPPPPCQCGCGTRVAYKGRFASACAKNIKVPALLAEHRRILEKVRIAYAELVLTLLCWHLLMQDAKSQANKRNKLIAQKKCHQCRVNLPEGYKTKVCSKCHAAAMKRQRKVYDRLKNINSCLGCRVAPPEADKTYCEDCREEYRQVSSTCTYVHTLSRLESDYAQHTVG